MPIDIKESTLQNIGGLNVLDSALRTSHNIMQQREAAQLRDLRSMQIQNAVQDWNERIYAAETVRMNADFMRKQADARLRRADKIINREIEAEDTAAVQNQLTGQLASYDMLLGNIGSPEAYNASLESARGTLPAGVYQELKSLDMTKPKDRAAAQAKFAHYRTEHLQRLHEIEASASASGSGAGGDGIAGSPQITMLQKHLDENSSFSKDESFGVSTMASQLGQNLRKRGVDILDTTITEIASRLFDSNPDKYKIPDPKAIDWPLVGKVSSALNIPALEMDVRNEIYGTGQVNPSQKYSSELGIDIAMWDRFRNDPKNQNLSDDQLAAKIRYNQGKK